jgi:Protein of unknown function (DUF2937)
VTTLLSYLRIFLFLGGTLVGIQVPFFVDQYGKSLESHYLESQRSISEFQDDANKHFHGSIEALITHYKNSGDAVFKDGGASIQAIYNRYLVLKESLAKFKSNAWSAFSQALFSPVADVSEEVRKHYSYAVKLDPAAVAFGLCSGLLLAAVIESLLRAFGALVTALFHGWIPES